jgi:hypothetical protein
MNVDQVKPIEPDGAGPSRMLGIARLDSYWQTPEARRLHDDAVRLRGTGSVPIPLRTRQTVRWREQAERLLTDVEQWSGVREPAPPDYFYEKSVLFVWLLDLMPQSSLRTRAVRALVDFMRRSDIDRDRRALWFAILNRILEMARGPQRREILAALEDSHHPILSFYARLERIEPSKRQ